MSYGLVICEKCKREVHQSGKREVQNGWEHCEDHSPICTDDSGRRHGPVYAQGVGEIRGKWCGADDLDGMFRN